MKGKILKKKIVKIDEVKCTGCGECAIDCHEGAIQIINGKAVVDNGLCDGLGACLGSCPEDAISIVEVEVDASTGAEKAKPQTGSPARPAPAAHVCPGSLAKSFASREPAEARDEPGAISSRLANWPVQIKLMPVNAPYLQDADLLICADCVPFALADFHRKLLAGKILLIGCPKLDDAELYAEKLAEMFGSNEIKSVEVAFMEVPCCSGLVRVVQKALKDSGKDIPLKLTRISIRGQVCEAGAEKSFGLGANL